MAEYLVQDSSLNGIANAIRNKVGISDMLKFPAGFVEAIQNISVSAGNGLKYDMGEFIFDADIASNAVWLKTNPIPHNLGDTPDFIVVWTDHWAGITEAPYTDNATMVGFVWLNGLTGIIGRASSAVNVTNPMIGIFNMPKSDYRCNFSSPTSASYGITDDRLPTQDAFYLATFGTLLWRSGVTYKYFVSKAWWNVGGIEHAE